jgi:hypothetical protein
MPKRENSVRPAKLPIVGIFLEDKENRVWDVKLPDYGHFLQVASGL